MKRDYEFILLEVSIEERKPGLGPLKNEELTLELKFKSSGRTDNLSNSEILAIVFDKLDTI